MHHEMKFTAGLRSFNQGCLSLVYEGWSGCNRPELGWTGMHLIGLVLSKDLEMTFVVNWCWINKLQTNRIKVRDAEVGVTFTARKLLAWRLMSAFPLLSVQRLHFFAWDPASRLYLQSELSKFSCFGPPCVLCTTRKVGCQWATLAKGWQPNQMQERLLAFVPFFIAWPFSFSKNVDKIVWTSLGPFF